ncbi:MAG: glutamine synthetase, partial [Chloroflexi bacterium]|nr:glutamine synthetase [Chloroflexota bacterium]
MKKKKVISKAQKANVRLIRFLYCDNGCTIRGKLAHVDDLAARMESGIGLTVAMQA